VGVVAGVVGAVVEVVVEVVVLLVFSCFCVVLASVLLGSVRGASVVVSGLYLLPSTLGMTALGLYAGRISARFGSRQALLAGTAFTTDAVISRTPACIVAPRSGSPKSCG